MRTVLFRRGNRRTSLRCRSGRCPLTCCLHRSRSCSPSGRHWIKSPEDTVLRKLLWFRQGGETSSTQWRDILQVLRISGASMDGDYLQEWALQLGVGDLLQRALSESGH